MSSLTESDKRERLVGKKVEFRLLDEEGKEVYSASVEPKTKKVDLVGWVDRYKKSEERVSLGFISFQHVGRIEFFYYENEPETLYIGHDNEKGRTFAVVEFGDAKRLLSLAMKVSNNKNVVGQYTKNRIDKRFKKYKDENKRLKEELASKETEQI